jgi:hypothetical protein
MMDFLEREFADVGFRFFEDALHMGYPLANGAVYPWMESVMGGK